MQETWGSLVWSVKRALYPSICRPSSIALKTRENFCFFKKKLTLFVACFAFGVSFCPFPLSFSVSDGQSWAHSRDTGRD